MALPNIFSKEVSEEIIARIHKLEPSSSALWGKMTVAQMLAHCNVTYEMVYLTKHPKPSAFNRFLFKMFIKGLVTNEKPYKKNSQTAPAFLMKEDKNFEQEKKSLIQHIVKTQQLGESYFDQKESLSFGVLTISEWNNMFYKHLDHHLSQFGV